MSVSLSVWEIDLNFLSRMHGAIRDPRANEIRVGLVRALDQRDLDDFFLDEIASGRCPHAAEALDDIMKGAIPSVGFGPMYAYVCETIVEYWGDALPGNSFAPSGTRLPDEVDAALAAMGVASFRVSALTSGTLPIAIPPCDDFPGFGHMTNRQCRDAWGELQRVRYGGNDPTVSAAIEDIRGWLRTVTRRKSTGLIGFFH